MNQSQSKAYTERLVHLQQSGWKRALDVQAPYRRHLQRLGMGRMLDIGCGIGRNLLNLGSGVGIDPNESAVEVARERGFTAYTPEAFAASPDYQPASYDSLLIAHVAEHIGTAETIALISCYLDLLKPGGQVVILTPQEAGYRTDATHVEFIDFTKLNEIAAGTGLTVVREYSFPFPRVVGRLFPYNEFVHLSRKPAAP